MSDVVIRCDGLGKKYRIGVNRQRYTALRDVMTERLKSLGRRMLGRPAPVDLPYEELWALKDVCFEVKRGECVGVIGRNGAGKSTLLKLLSRITEPSTGRIHLKGRVASLLEVGTGFHPELTGRENIYLNGAILGMRRSEIRRKFDDIVVFAEIGKFLDTPVKHYSTGMYMRLAFAVAAHLEPEILVVDEVLAVGDAEFQKKCLGKMSSVASEGRTVLFVSHNLSSISALCSTGLFLQQGQVAAARNIDECLSLYAGAAGEVTSCWEGPTGDEHVQVLRAYIAAPGGRTVFSRGEIFEVFIEYEITIDDPNYVLGIEIFNARGFMLCVNALTQSAPPHLARAAVQRGKHQVAIKVDTGIFADGYYSIKLDVGIHDFKRIVLDEISLQFQVLADNLNTAQTADRRKDVIYPPWQWRLSV